MAKVDFRGEEPKAVWSINLNTAQLVLGFIARLAGAGLLVWAMVNWSASYVFQRELERFHREAVPEIERMIDSRVALQEAQGAATLANRLDEINQRLSRIEGQLGRAETRDTQ